MQLRRGQHTAIVSLARSRIRFADDRPDRNVPGGFLVCGAGSFVLPDLGRRRWYVAV